MKVSAISFSSKNHPNRVKNNNVENKYSNQYSENPISHLKSVPLVAIIAMSPLNTSAINSSIQQTQQLEQTALQNDTISVLGKKEITTKNEDEFCRFIAYNTDKNSKNAELMGFNYNCYTNDGNIGVMTGIFQSVCPDRTDNNEYLATYEEIINFKNTGEVKTCLIPEEFGDYLLKFAASRYNNNAIDIVSKKELQEVYGADVIENTEDIRNLVSTVKYPQD
ncbi:MAG: hypothetical protein ACI37Q_04190 [Candidatus Gastranaerophilaceae bacterium]